MVPVSFKKIILGVRIAKQVYGPGTGHHNDATAFPSLLDNKVVFLFVREVAVKAS